MHSYEIEIKTLLGDEENKNVFLEKLTALNNCVEGESNVQKNNYYINGDLRKVRESVQDLVSGERLALFDRVITEGQGFSNRSREINGEVILVVKAGIDDTSTDNGISRIEFEEKLPLSLQELDDIFLEAGFETQAKWSRSRTEYHVGDIIVCLDKNAGYGYVAEFEMVVDDPSLEQEVKDKLYGLMSELGVEELDQDRLARMFEYYNQNWRDYYGTDNTFIIN